MADEDESWRASHPNPQMLDEHLTLAGVDHYKRVDCQHYERCLNYAAVAGWTQFHCRSCLVYVLVDKNDSSHKKFHRAGQKLSKTPKRLPLHQSLVAEPDDAEPIEEGTEASPDDET